MKKITITLFIITAFGIKVLAQYGSVGTMDARSMGMGKTANSISVGAFSSGINPANLLNSNYNVDFTTVLPLPNISINSGTNFISTNDINYYFGGVNGQPRILTADDEQRLNSLFDNGGLILGEASVTLFSIGIRLSQSNGALGFSIIDFISGNITIPQALSSLLLYGNSQGDTYNFSDTKLSSWWIRDYSLTYARDITGILADYFVNLNAGVTFKLVKGFAFAQSTQVGVNSLQTGTNNQLVISTNYSIQSAFSDDFNVKYSFDTTSTNNNANIGPFPTPAGSGFGFDVGFNGFLKDNWNVSLAVTDIGSITWNSNTAITSSSGQYTLDDLTDQAHRDSLKNKFKGSSVQTGSFSTDLPTALRIGISHKFSTDNLNFPGTLLLALDINKGFNDNPGNSTSTRFSFGAEWQPMDGFPFLRTGASFGGLLGSHWALGLGYDAGIVEFNFATFDMQSFISPNSARTISAALDSRWKF